MVNDGNVRASDGHLTTTFITSNFLRTLVSFTFTFNTAVVQIEHLYKLRIINKTTNHQYLYEFPKIEISFYNRRYMSIYLYIVIAHRYPFKYRAQMKVMFVNVHSLHLHFSSYTIQHINSYSSISLSSIIRKSRNHL